MARPDYVLRAERAYRERRKEKKTPVQVWLSQEELAKLDAHAEMLGEDRTRMIRRWIMSEPTASGWRRSETPLPTFSEKLEAIVTGWEESEHGPLTEPAVRARLEAHGFDPRTMPRPSTLRRQIRVIREERQD